MHRSTGPCVEFPVTTLALRRSSRCKVGLCRYGLECSEIFIAVQAVHRFCTASELRQLSYDATYMVQQGMPDCSQCLQKPF
ncbi:hypothetical protein NDU88_004598 [Pleurodeles waltl]|uniref:Uncharacterized protein n=1 Tax=Pleurodeles waltl TaxID=8319 RepID=A0AAV7SJ78_PLEWA|nr:hypothetical protein NDU88_004598 [Pleurodeles waltl]